MRQDTSFQNAHKTPYWAETVATTPTHPALHGDITCDLAIVGGGFSGLWSALMARDRFPDARIVLLEADHLGNAASGRNGGFCAPSISHGVSNALSRWPDEAETLIRMGRQNMNELEADLGRFDIDAEFERPGKLNLAATPWEAEGLKTMQTALTRFGIGTEYLEGAALRARLNSPKYIAGLYETDYALLNPTKTVHGLARSASDQGVEIHEHSAVTALSSHSDGITLNTRAGRVIARQVILATNASVPLLKRLQSRIIPVFDYTLMTEPLSDAQLHAIGWTGRYGIADSGNQFHYSRKTADSRILWGGYDAIYHRGNRRDAALLDRPESYARLEANFRATFPALGEVAFSHAWGGIIDTSARLTFFVGTAMKGRLAYALGFTGQGVSATRFAALTMLDLLQGKQTERTQLRMARSWAPPFPPEPFRSLAVSWAQADLAREDQTGQRSLLLKALDRLGIGFGS
ncbi:FAD-binding oxidoreductase [Rhodobacteraceae bacterium M382]|nr:FAD-binding oxidoreductase [Rhodobacteraceae bacterium M382]